MSRLKCPALALTVVLLLGVLAHAQKFTVLWDLGTCYPCSGGGFPNAGVIQDGKGNLYGTTSRGGDAGCDAPYGCGVVFRVSAGGIETVLHRFQGAPDGAGPVAALLRNAAGGLYGTAANGGDLSCDVQYGGCGVVFKIDSSGNETVVYTFKGGTADGCGPFAGLVQDKDGNLYGTTAFCGTSNLGTVFKVTKTGQETVLHNFAGAPNDGATPGYGRLLPDNEGNLYGVTFSGGSTDMGTAYKMSGAGELTLLYSFTGGVQDGCYPYGTLAIDGVGSLYGTTVECGGSGYGTVWKLTKHGQESVLHSFTGGSSDGANPIAGVVRDAEGNLYGDTSAGGFGGIIYKLTKRGKLILLHSFLPEDGEYPIDDLLRSPKGILYGTTFDDGPNRSGTVWSYVP